MQESHDVPKSLKRLLIFQLKLAADALRDFLLSPLSILTFVLDIVLKPEESYYEKLMSLGRESDRWINLFDHYPEPVQPFEKARTHRASSGEIDEQ